MKGFMLFISSLNETKLKIKVIYTTIIGQFIFRKKGIARDAKIIAMPPPLGIGRV